MTKLSVGDKAPLFTLKDQDGKAVKLSQFKGKNVVVYFYPKADTPGCTTQACSIRDRSDDYAAAGVRVLGVSPDPVKKVKKFHDKRELNFTLLADEDHAVCDAYGVWVEKSMYGKVYMGIDRSTVLVDARGRVARIWRKVKVPGHAAEVMAAARALAP